MNQFLAMKAFRAVVDSGSFSAASDRLGMTSGAVSKLVRALEAHLAVQLLNRTTRRLSLTEPGQGYYARCVEILDAADEADRDVSRYHAVARGVLRVNAPMAFGSQHLATLLPAFLAQYPDIRADLVLDDRFCDVVEEGYDCALRIVTQLPDSSLVARRLAPIDRVLCASPDYLARHGEPATPAELADHNCLIYSLAGEANFWSFAGPAGIERVEVKGSIRANTSLALREAALAGTGIILSANFVVGDDLRQGRLQRLLPGYEIPPRTLFAVYPQNRSLLPKVRVFIDFLAAAYRNPAWQS
ncbi:MAG: LysR family transcriptional regulator [Sulfuricella sp.]